MKAERWRRVESLFAAAQSLGEADAASYIREHCDGDAKLEQEVASLLRFHHSDNSLLVSQGVPWPHLLRDFVDSELPLTGEPIVADDAAGDDIGPYRLKRLLGRGGMGSVWYAERPDGLISRGVALKLPLALGKQLAARFAREREIIAKLTHPNIARLYDAGFSRAGQAYIALEYVDGQALLDYCNSRHLSPSARINLFEQVLSAVQYAHSRLVIHRDLKPSNILVSSDGQVHLLDFGVAKMLDDSGDDGSDLTRMGGAAITLAYAAPEQLTDQPVSTSADIYSLGVILHELLTGVSPYGITSERRFALQQIILEADIAVPSSVTITAEAAVARDRSVAALRKELRGDLDAIVLRALARQPEGRYPTVSAFVDDLTRYRCGQPVWAHCPSRSYRLRKFMWRHRFPVVGVSAASLALLVLASVAVWQAHAAAVQAARAATVRDFMFDFIDGAEPNEARPDEPVTGKEMITGAVHRARLQFAAQPALEGELLGELARMYVRLDDTDSARPLFAEAIRLLEGSVGSGDPALNKTRAHLADVLVDDNDIAQAKVLAARARAQCTSHDSDCAKARAYADTVLSKLALIDGDIERAVSATRDSVRETILAFGPTDPETAMAMLNLAVIARNAGRLREASTTMDDALAIADHKTLPAADRTQLLQTAAVLDLDMGRYELARKRLEELIYKASIVAERAIPLRLLANTLFAQGETRAALKAADDAIALADPGAKAAEVLFARQVHAQALALLGRASEAQSEIQAVIVGLLDLGRSSNSPELLRAHRIRAEVLLRAGRSQDALAELQPLAEQLIASMGEHELETGQTLDLLGCALRELDRFGDASAMHARARVLLAKQLPAEHPFLERNALYQELADRDADAFARRAVRLEARLSPTSVWRELLDARSNASPCRSPEAALCIFVL